MLRLHVYGSEAYLAHAQWSDTNYNLRPKTKGYIIVNE